LIVVIVVIVVTGASGAVGSALLGELRACTHRPRILVNNTRCPVPGAQGPADRQFPGASPAE
jgi:uncharacterized protein YbjT (DUF2867 family)